jgi:hypothetical protein
MLGIRDNVLRAVIHQIRGFGLLHRLRCTALYRGVAPYLPGSVRDLGNGLIGGGELSSAASTTSERRARRTAEPDIP